MKHILVIFLVVFSVACNKQAKNTLPETVGSKIEAFELKNGQFFLYVENYHCNLKGKMVLSYKDSIYFTGNQLCQTGDVCTSKVKCTDPNLVKDLKIHDDNLQLHAFGGNYLYGKDLSETDGVPDLQGERQIASVQTSTPLGGSPADKLFIYLLWCIAFGALFYMHAPEY